MVIEAKTEISEESLTVPGCGVLLITGTEPSFCSGANVRGFNQRIQNRESAEDEGEANLLPWRKMESRYATRGQKVAFGGQASRIPVRIHKLQKPSVAAVNGHAMGVALACDIRYASEKAVFSEAFARMRPATLADGGALLLGQRPSLTGASKGLEINE